MNSNEMALFIEAHPLIPILTRSFTPTLTPPLTPILPYLSCTKGTCDEF